MVGGLLDGRQGGLLDPHGGHRETVLLGQVGEVGGAQDRAPRLCQPPRPCAQTWKDRLGGVEHGAGVVGDAVVQEDA